MPQYFRKKGTTQIVTETGEVTTDPNVMKSIPNIGALPIWEERELPEFKPRVTRYGEEAEKYLGGLDITPLTATEEGDIREQRRKAVQEQIDALEEMYTGLKRREEEAGVERLGMTRAMAARGGRLTSEIGVAQLAKTERYTAEQIKLLESEKTLKVQALLAQADERAEKEIELQKERERGNIAASLAYLKDIKEEAKENWTKLANSGQVSLDRIKTNKEYYEQALEELGKSEIGFDLWWESELPKTQQIDYSEIQYKGDNGNIWLKRIGFDPMTQAKTEYNYDLELPYPAEPTEIKIFEGVPYKAVKDEKGNVISYKRIPGVEEKGLKRTTASIWKVIAKTGKTRAEVEAMSDVEFAGYLEEEKVKGEDWDWARELIRLNLDPDRTDEYGKPIPVATYEELEAELRSNENTKDLSPADIKSLLEAAGVKPRKEREREEEEKERKWTDEEIRQMIYKYSTSRVLEQFIGGEITPTTEKGEPIIATKDQLLGLIARTKEMSETDRERAKLILNELITPEFDAWIQKLIANPEKYRIRNKDWRYERGIYEKKILGDKLVYSF